MKNWLLSSLDSITRLVVQGGIGLGIAYAVYLAAEALCRSTRAKRRAG